MAIKLTDATVKALPVPEKGNRIHYDTDVKGFGARVTAAGAIAFVLNYRTRGGRERRYTIGAFPDWKTAAARTEAAELKRRIDRGEDPMGEVAAERAAPSMADLCKRFDEEVLSKRRPNTQVGYRAQIKNWILPAMRSLKVADVTFSDVDALHRKITAAGHPYAANRTVALLSKLFSLSIKWEYRTDNPVQGIERNTEQKRKRYLSPAELARLSAALNDHEDKQASNIIRLLLLTGARRNEVQSMRWADLDLEKGVWSKPGATTKQRADHVVPLSAPARQLLVELSTDKKRHPEYVFRGRSGGHRQELKKDWADLCKAAAITECRIHDLRHTYASVLASAGLSLPIIGALLGHTQPSTTQRYAHLFDDPLRQATERVAAVVSPTGKGAEVVVLKGGVS